jgi:dihydroneopterin aldolase
MSHPDQGAIDGDRIFLRGLRVDCIIGYIDWERQLRQTLEIDLEFPVDCARAAESDDVADSTDYKSVAKRALQFVAASEFQLVETLAHRLALLLLDEFGLDWLRITINKPGAIRHSRDVGVSLLRRRNAAPRG